MNKLGFFGIVNLIVIILLIVGAVVSYNFFKSNFVEGEDESGNFEKAENSIEYFEDEEIGNFEDKDLNENLEIE